MARKVIKLGNTQQLACLTTEMLGSVMVVSQGVPVNVRNARKCSMEYVIWKRCHVMKVTCNSLKCFSGHLPKYANV